MIDLRMKLVKLSPQFATEFEVEWSVLIQHENRSKLFLL